jgi:tetratricopeptide (TPR) repeat protein
MRMLAGSYLVLALLIASFATLQSVCANPSVHWAEPVNEYRSLVTDSHGDLSLLRQRTEEMERSLPQFLGDTPVARDAYIALAKVHFMYGEMGTKKGARIKQYQQCADYAHKAVDLDDKSAEAHFWYFSGLARQVELKGIFRAVMTGAVFKVKGQITRAHDLDAHDAYILSGLGAYYWKAPKIIGGSKEKARAYLEEATKSDPRLSYARLTLAKVLIDMGEKKEAKEELDRVLHLQSPSDPNFYQFVNIADARRCWDKVKNK